MGKTIQMTSLMLAIFDKTGTYEDKVQNRLRRSKDCVFDARGRRDGYPPPCLVVCPASVVSNWLKELKMWGHFLQDNLDGSKNASKIFRDIGRGHLDVVVTSYDSMSNNHEQLAKIDWSIIIFDEGHTLKNPTTIKYINAMKITKARVRFVLTGTPVQNNYEGK